MLYYSHMRNTINRIEINPKKLGGKPVIRGTRISLEQILRLLAVGVPLEDIMTDFPQLTRADILAAVEYAAELMEDFKVYPHKYVGRIKLQPA